LDGCRSKTEIGRKESCALLAELVITGRSSAIPLAEAKRYAEEGCAGSIADGCVALGRYRMDHENNPDAAKRDFEQACKLGRTVVCEALLFESR
jgi:NAD(P)-dependent dehydrogenase (short-subunit alcohol dehydrogenase family)